MRSSKALVDSLGHITYSLRQKGSSFPFLEISKDLAEGRLKMRLRCSHSDFYVLLGFDDPNLYSYSFTEPFYE
jgi:hypothetical protein